MLVARPSEALQRACQALAIPGRRWCLRVLAAWIGLLWGDGRHPLYGRGGGGRP
ncbi:hypothetical protein [Nonomuraea zeae]|uniref:hypothetical protein n=1 Tax=Nonomuraea zeae TaxID=1642303 RepID=UPI003606D0DB